MDAACCVDGLLRAAHSPLILQAYFGLPVPSPNFVEKQVAVSIKVTV